MARMNPFQAGPGVFNPAAGSAPGQQAGTAKNQRRAQASQQAMQQQQMAMNQESARAAIANAQAQTAMQRRDMAHRHHANTRKFEDNKLVREILQKQNAGLLKAENDKIAITRENAALARKKWAVNEALVKAQTEQGQIAVAEARANIPFREKQRERGEREAAAMEKRNIQLEKERQDTKRLQLAKDKHDQLQKVGELTLGVLTGGMATAAQKTKMAREGSTENMTLGWNSRKDILVNLDALYGNTPIGEGSPVAKLWTAADTITKKGVTESEKMWTGVLQRRPSAEQEWQVVLDESIDPELDLGRKMTEGELMWKEVLKNDPSVEAAWRYALSTKQDTPFALGSRSERVPIRKLSSADKFLKVLRKSGMISSKGLLRLERSLETMVGGKTLELGATGNDSVYGPNLFMDAKTGKFDYVGYASLYALVSRFANPKKTEQSPAKMVETASALLVHLDAAELAQKGPKGAAKTLFPAQEIARWKQPLDTVSLDYNVRQIANQIEVEVGAPAIMEDVKLKLGVAGLIKDPVKREQAIEALKAMVQPPGPQPTPANQILGFPAFGSAPGKAWLMLDAYSKKLDAWTDPNKWLKELSTRRLGTKSVPVTKPAKKPAAVTP